MQHTIRVEHEQYVYIDDKLLRGHLTQSEYKVLTILMRSTSIVTHDMLLNQVYSGMDEPSDTKIFAVFICRLRKLMAPHNVINTVWGRGWSWNKDYVFTNSSVATMQVDVPMEYLDTICFVTGEDAQTAVVSLVKQKYKQLQEM